jgi:CubicO group peptidase (beta-lactamase class C family)
MWYGSSFNRKELFDRLQYLEPSKGFRYGYQYNNLMYVMAGYLVGQISGGSWEKFVQQRIFDPLGMENSNFSVTESQKSSNFAQPHLKSEDGVKQIPFRNIDAMAPAGSIGSSATEMAKWILLNLNNGRFDGKQVISEGNLKQIHSPQMVVSGDVRYNELLNASYGMGWIIQSYRGHNIIHPLVST